MGMMDLRRQMMGVIAQMATNSGIPNMLKGVATYPGYISNTGSISAQSNTQKEVYSDQINVDSEQIILILKDSASKSVWTAVGCYGDNGFIQRIAPASQKFVVGSNDYYMYTITLATGTKKVSFTWRTFDEIEVFACTTSEFFESMEYV